MGDWLRRRWLMVAAGLLVLLVGGVTWLLWPSPEEPAPRERTYRAETACLLTDDRGLAGDHARAAWTGMREASESTLVKVQYLAVAGPQTAANASSYFNSLGLQKCQVIVAVGEAPVGAMAEGASRFSEVRLVAVGGQAAAPPVTLVDATSEETIRAGVRQFVIDAA